MRHLLEIWVGWVLHGGYWGIIVLMAMESSIFPVPSEVVIPPAAFLAAQGKLSFSGVVLAGTLGSYLGAAITYWISRVIGRPLIVRYGRFFLISPKKLERAENWLARYELGGVFFARLLPVVRHLHFNSGRNRADEFLDFQRGHNRGIRDLVLAFSPILASKPIVLSPNCFPIRKQWSISSRRNHTGFCFLWLDWPACTSW